MSKRCALTILFCLAAFSGCGNEETAATSGSGGGSGTTVPKPKRMPPERYVQSASTIPIALNDQYFLATAAWAAPESGLSYLWSFADLNVFAQFSSLALPANEIIVAVIDTGVDMDHEDLAGRLWVNPVESADGFFNNDADDDNDGYVDDFLGWDFANNMNNPADDSGHGTHVAGTIGAVGGNGLGIVGVAPWVRIMALKVCGSGGSCDSGDIRAAMAYAVEHGAKIINLSLGAYDTGADADAFDEAIADATDAGVLVFAAAGNGGVDASGMTPANATFAVPVAAHRNDGAICSFSNYGWKVDLSGPGCGFDGQIELSGILSLNSRKCGAAADQYCATTRTVGEKYTRKSGTSMSTPHAAGMAAVAWTASPEATPLQIRQALLRSARKNAADSITKRFGMGKLDGTTLIDEARTAPGLKIVSPRYGSASEQHDISFRIEARDHPVGWILRYQSLVDNPSQIDFTGGTVIAGSINDIGASEHVTVTANWAPPTPGTYLVILEATTDGRKYYDVTSLSRL